MVPIDLDGIGRAIAQEKCAQPKVKRRGIENTHDSKVVDTVETYACPGFEVEIYRATAFDPPAELPLSVVVRRAHPRVPPGIGVGASSAALVDALGPPLHAEDGKLVYSLEDEAGADTVTFELTGGRVRSIRWSFDVD